MRKTIIGVAVLALMTAATGLAKTGSYRSICLTMADQSTLLVNMDKSMSLGFGDGNLSVTTDEFELAFPLADVNSWNFSEKWSPNKFVEDPDPEPDPVYEPEGDGSALTPFNTIALTPENEGTTAWVTGYIVGSFLGNSIEEGANFSSTGHVAGNILLAPAADVTDPALCVGVQMLSSTAFRPELNLINNPANLGREIAIRGRLASYGGKTGLTRPDKYCWGNQGEDDPVTGINPAESDNAGISLEGNTISLANLPAGLTVSLYDAAGRTVLSETASGSRTISLDGLSRGVYILSINGMNIKISVNR
ncbi:MAG: T9SS type A sorting domain-containing protein [Clostridium sp.]|nr:T9SS type A sorting domain-containing protein [Clostridium sp.]